MPSPEDAKSFLEANCGVYKDDGKPASFDTLTLQDISNIRATDGEVICDFFVSQRAQNRFSTLHGGCIATIVDVVGTAALATQSENLGVSLNLSVDYLTAMPVGEVCEVTAKVVRVGKTIGTADVEFRRKSDGTLTASGRHVKYLKPGSSLKTILPRVISKL